MIALSPRSHAAASPSSACAFLRGEAVCDGSMGHLEATACGFAGWRGAVCFREEGRADRGEEQEPTDRGPDKRPQGAARSVGCFCWEFSLIRQCAASARNVRAACNTFPELGFLHIAGAGHG